MAGATAVDTPEKAAHRPSARPRSSGAKLDDTSAINLILFRKLDRQLQKRMLKRGKVVFNGGLYLTYAWQRIASDYSGASANCANGGQAIGCQPGELGIGYTRRGAKVSPVGRGDVLRQIRPRRAAVRAAQDPGALGRFTQATPQGPANAGR